MKTSRSFYSWLLFSIKSIFLQSIIKLLLVLKSIIIMKALLVICLIVSVVFVNSSSLNKLLGNYCKNLFFSHFLRNQCENIKKIQEQHEFIFRYYLATLCNFYANLSTNKNICLKYKNICPFIYFGKIINGLLQGKNTSIWIKKTSNINNLKVYPNYKKILCEKTWIISKIWMKMKLNINYA